MSTLSETSSSAAQRWHAMETQEEANGREIDRIQREADEAVERIEAEERRLRLENARFGLRALTEHGMAALTDPEVFALIHRSLLEASRYYVPLFQDPNSLAAVPLMAAVRSFLQRDVPFVHHVFIDRIHGPGEQDDTVQIRMVIPVDADLAQVAEAARLLQPLLEVQLLTLPRVKGYGNPSITVQVAEDYSQGACVVWLEDGAIRIPAPMGGGEFLDLSSALMEARDRAVKRGSDLT